MGTRLLLLVGLCCTALVYTSGQTLAATDVCSAFTACGGESTTCTCTKGCPGGGDGGDGGIVCKTHSDCKEDQACIRRRCQDPCSGRCGANTECKVVNHHALCKCLPNYEGNPITGCELEKPTLCDENAICGSKKACVGQTCIDPCILVSCPEDSICQAVNHEVTCVPKPKVKPECTRNVHCPGDRACLFERCIDPCAKKFCAKDYRCEATNHKVKCVPVPKVINCEEDEECPAGKACDGQHCVNPCTDVDCGPKAKCEVIDHIVTCISTKQPNECTDDDNCATDKQCVNQVCVDPCKNTECKGTCSVLNHKAICIGPPIPGKCTANGECPTDQQCIVDKCVNPCENDVCPKDNLCYVKDHEVQCIPDPNIVEKPCSEDKECETYQKCNAGKCFDPCKYLRCTGSSVCLTENHITRCKPKPEVECNENNDCATDKTCSNEKCINPCLTHVCGKNSICQVKDHQIKCITQVPWEPECKKNEDCKSHLNCIDEKCKDPCKVGKEKKNPCGAKKECKVTNHDIECIYKPDDEGECLEDADCPSDRNCVGRMCIDYCKEEGVCPKGICSVQNHQVLCRIIPVLPDRCKTNENCKDDKACKGGKCVNPCDGKPCDEDSVCTVEKHSVYCKGKPPPDVTCTDNSACPEGTVCSNGKCVFKCVAKNCGKNSYCVVIKGVATCACSTGFVGDPEKGCEEEGDDGGNGKNGNGGDDGGDGFGWGLGNCSANNFPQKPKEKKKFVIITGIKTSWWGGFHYCIAHGLRLAVVENKEEHELVLQELKRTNIKNGRFWISGTQQGFLYRWMWMTTGLPVANYTVWNPPPYPTGHLCMDYAEFYNRGYMWADQCCAVKQHFICEDYEYQIQISS